MKIEHTSSYEIALLSVILLGIIGLFTIGHGNNIPVWLTVGVVVGLVVSILIILERNFLILLDKYQPKNDD